MLHGAVCLPAVLESQKMPIQTNGGTKTLKINETEVNAVRLKVFKQTPRPTSPDI